MAWKIEKSRNHIDVIYGWPLKSNKDINFFKSGLDQGKILRLKIRNVSLIDNKSGIEIASRDK